ncbi:hypothetical protein OCU04_012422 [Sclerotinia nivalis]|uniref:Uncharacterized protein n=1 Tax=Sclerotinia nivalis TaxID=352851 RepID=A0A9X0A8Q0_9HELO|nr:hypothetical protein OCU04_012422 [Sclerotinia nivalis]
MKECITRVVILQDTCPKIFRYIVQYMNTQCILVPGSPRPVDSGASDLEDAAAFRRAVYETEQRMAFELSKVVSYRFGGPYEK